MHQEDNWSEAAATALHVCKDLAHLPPGIGFEALKQHVSSIAALREFIVEGAAVSAQGNDPQLVRKMTRSVKKYEIVPSMKGVAMHGLQQAGSKPSLLQPEELQLITMTCEVLGHAISIGNGELAVAAKWWADKSSKRVEAAGSSTRKSRPQSHEDLLTPIAKACSALAADLESAVQQQQQQQQQQQPIQQQKPKGLRGGFLASLSQRRQPSPKQLQEPAQQQQQQQQRSGDSLSDQSFLSLGMSLGRGLLTIWNAAVASLSDGTCYSSTMFQTPASRAALLPVVQLLLAMLKARKTFVHCTYSNKKEEVAAMNSVAISGALMLALSEAITRFMTPLIELPGVRQFATSEQLQQLLFINLAWHVELLDRLRQGKRSVVSAEVSKRLGNKASRPTKQQQPAPGGSSSSSGGDSVVPPHHLVVFQLLGVADHDPARCTNTLVEDTVISRLPDACTATAMALQYSYQGIIAAAAGSAAGRPATADPGWPQKAVALVRMLLQLQQLLPQAEVVLASCNALVQVMQTDFGVWKLAIASEANQELLLLLQPAVLQTVHRADRQQQQQQEMIGLLLRLSGVLLCNMAPNVDPDHWKKAIVASPQECCASLDVAFRTMGAAAAAVASGSSSPNMTGYMPPRQLFIAARYAMLTIQDALREGKASVALVQPTEAARDNLVQQQHAPFLFSVMATLLKCGTALRQADPVSALIMAECVAGLRVRSDAFTPAAAAAAAWRGDGVFAELRGNSSTRSSGSRSKSGATQALGSRGRVGDWKSSSEIVQQGLISFRPGCAGSSSSNCSSANGICNVWYREDQIAMVTPWIVAAARSMFLIGQVLCEVLAEQQQHKQQQQPQMIASPRVCEDVLLDVFACVEWLGSELCHIYLPEDTVDDGSKDDISSRGCDSGSGPGAHDCTVGSAANSQGSSCSHAALQQLLEQHSQTQQALLQAVQRCLSTNSSSSNVGGGGGQIDTKVLQQFKQVWGLKTAQHLRDFAASVTAGLPVGYCCNNPNCCNLNKLSELQLVAGSGKLCGQCRVARYCGPVCQKAHWKMHKAACKQLAAQAAVGQM